MKWQSTTSLDFLAGGNVFETEERVWTVAVESQPDGTMSGARVVGISTTDPTDIIESDQRTDLVLTDRGSSPSKSAFLIPQVYLLDPASGKAAFVHYSQPDDEGLPTRLNVDVLTLGTAAITPQGAVEPIDVAGTSVHVEWLGGDLGLTLDGGSYSLTHFLKGLAWQRYPKQRGSVILASTDEGKHVVSSDDQEEILYVDDGKAFDRLAFAEAAGPVSPAVAGVTAAGVVVRGALDKRGRGTTSTFVDWDGQAHGNVSGEPRYWEAPRANRGVAAFGALLARSDKETVMSLPGSATAIQGDTAWVLDESYRGATCPLNSAKGDVELEECEPWEEDTQAPLVVTEAGTALFYRSDDGHPNVWPADDTYGEPRTVVMVEVQDG